MNLLTIPVVFFALFTQSIAGFGSGLIAMPLLIGLIGLETATPTFALLAQTSGLLLILRFRQEMNFAVVWRLLLMSVIAVPIGVWFSGVVNEHLAKFILGAVTVGYAIYTLLGLSVPRLKQRWAFSFGFLSGLLGGGYNMGGPPLVIYGTSQRWKPGEFRSNISSVFFPTGFVTISSHFLHGNITPKVLQYYGMLLPVLLAAMFLGFYLDRYIKPEPFRRGVLVLLIILGTSLIL
ncbi:MAG: sulfite exporter TauE/SafE family protein [Anaerolineae bacterium]|nr:sulfite exporter TauE/SafE family protein [Anaerolineae bacterium]